MYASAKGPQLVAQDVNAFSSATQSTGLRGALEDEEKRGRVAWVWVKKKIVGQGLTGQFQLFKVHH